MVVVDRANAGAGLQPYAWSEFSSRQRGTGNVVASNKSGQSAVVTGAGSGLGRDIALALAARGYIVFGTAFAAVEVQDLKQASGGRVSLTVCDITKEQAVRAWAAGVSDALGATGLDLLVNNAGILTPGPLEICAASTPCGMSSRSMCSAPCRS